MPGRHKGTPPDLFGEGRGTVVEGSWTPDGHFKATLVMAKHAEDYQASPDGATTGYRDLRDLLLRSGLSR